MYKHLGIDDWLFVAIYGAVALSTRGENIPLNESSISQSGAE